MGGWKTDGKTGNTTEAGDNFPSRPSGLQGRYKGSNLPALNEPRLRTRILGAKLAYIAGVGQGGRLPGEVGEVEERRCRCSQRYQIDIET